jgi:hypothetical protein
LKAAATEVVSSFSAWVAGMRLHARALTGAATEVVWALLGSAGSKQGALDALAAAVPGRA